MSDNAPTFRLVRLPRGEQAATVASPPAASAPPPTPPPRQAEPVTTPSATIALFPGAAAALAFLGQVAGAGLAEFAGVRRSPDGRWRIEVPVAASAASPLAAAAGGTQPQAGAPGADWPPASLGVLVAAVALPPAVRPDAGEAVVVTVAALVRTVLRQAAAMGLAVEVLPAVRTPMAGGAELPAVALRLRWAGTRAPRTLLTALARLPETAVARPVAAMPAAPGAPLRGLLVDMHLQPPPAAAMIAELVPEEEAWLLSDPVVGCWRLGCRGTAMDGLALLAPDGLPEAVPPLPAGAAPLPEAVPLSVCLVPDPATASGVADAVLLADDELAWTRRFLMARPGVAETAFLLPGPQRHLLLAPGGLLERVPFGIALRRFGDEPLLLEQGQRFFPPLPAAARPALFGAGPDELVVVARADATTLFVGRYALAALRPAWLLWLAEPPPVATGIAGTAARRLRALAERVDRDRPAPPAEPGPIVSRLRRLRGREESRADLLRRALVLESAGQFVTAAELLEQAGEPLRAARLYERAAGEGR